MPELSLEIWIFACAISIFAGFIKGVVGFALPMIMIAGLSNVMPPELALAALILPALVSNLWQALRQGMSAAFASALVHWRYLVVLLVFIALSAQLVFILPGWAMFLILGIPITLFSVAQLAGWSLSFPEASRRKWEFGVASFSGFVGGISGVWGPPTVAYLTALNVPKIESVRVQGVLYGMGAVMLLLSHLQSGVFNASTAQLSAAMLIPVGVGLALGTLVHDRLDQALFKRATLVVLVVAGLNLIRRGLIV